jgi:hypothetical protein
LLENKPQKVIYVPQLKKKRKEEEDEEEKEEEQDSNSPALASLEKLQSL